MFEVFELFLAFSVSGVPMGAVVFYYLLFLDKGSFFSKLAFFVALILIVPIGLVGIYTLLYVLVLPMKAPADTSNRIAHLRLIWTALKAPEVFENKRGLSHWSLYWDTVHCAENYVDEFPWLMLDERDLLRKAGYQTQSDEAR